MAIRTLLPTARVINRPWRSPFDNLFDAFFGEDSRLPVLTGNAAFAPRIDVKEDDASYEISAELPGLEEKDIEITVDDGTLVLRGEKSAASEEKEGQYFRQERIYGRFERAFHLPDGVQRRRHRSPVQKRRPHPPPAQEGGGEKGRPPGRS